MELFGFNWRIGRNWGIAHPDDICYANQSAVHVSENSLVLDILHEPAIFNDKEYPWAIGYVSTLETIKYGIVEVKFRLPLGCNLWPAIWLTDGKTWPPEIDVVEAWSKKRKGFCWKNVYRKNLLANNIYPSFHLGTNPDEHVTVPCRILGGSPACWINPLEVNTCKLIWQPDMVEIYYNNHKVVEEVDPEILGWFQRSEGMEIHLNNYVTNTFTEKDYRCLKESQFLIEDLRYTEI